jgi:DNA-binding transcriptional regulator PaaX
VSRKPDYSRKILKLLAQKPAVAAAEVFDLLDTKEVPKKPLYAISRSLRGLEDGGFLDRAFSGQQEYLRITKAGKKRAHSIILEQDTTLVNPTWDGKWRIVLLDLPESRKDERDALRYLLKKAGFVCVKNAVWISPFPYEHLFANIKKDFDLQTELMIFVTDTIDQETKKSFFATFSK